MQAWSPSGLKAIAQVEWGSHFAQFFQSGDGLAETLVPFFKAGLENHESCLWVTGAAFTAEDARSALGAVMPDLARREKTGQITITDARGWYRPDQKIEPSELVGGLMNLERQALDAGYAGLRANGNCAWVTPEQWNDFRAYEALLQSVARGRRMILLCSYCLSDLHATEQHDVMVRHDMVLPTLHPSSNNGPGLDDPRERERRIFDLAMLASDMGTWRYTLADNVCIYDRHAQRLYGLTEARFLHDEEGVKAKFHPDDMELMWSRVAKALEPGGDGRYDVEYRVKQLDGSWRWLSAWGLVEFEGEGAARKAVAITGASRDLTERKQAEELQKLLLSESNHRIKNTFAAIQGIAAQTLRNSPDLASARDTLNRRIHAMAQAHDLLMSRDWVSANLGEVVSRSLAPFHHAQVETSGPAVDVPSRHALALSLALHELATNATKYGALSVPEGRVLLFWHVRDGMLRFEWEEMGGPAVVAPTRKGFGSRLLELALKDFGGETELSYPVTGVRCSIAMRL